MEAADKRRAQRFPIELPVALTIKQSEGEGTAVKTKDISSSGIYFEFSAPIDVGSSLEFILTLPGEITQGKAVKVKCRGKVVRVDQGALDGNAVGLAATIERYEFVRTV